MTFKDMKIEDIIQWCQDNNQVKWLKETAKKTTDCKVYPRVKVEREFFDENGNEYVKTVSVADKTQPYTIEKRPISYVEIKTAFCNKFMPELLENNKKPTMYDLIANL